MQDKEQNYKDKKLEKNLQPDDAPQPDVCSSNVSLETEHAQACTANSAEAQPLEFVADDAPLKKPTIEDEFAEARRVGHAHHDGEDATNAVGTAHPTESDDDEPDDDIEPLEPEEYETTLETVIEAVLFAGDEPLSSRRLVDIAEAGSVKQIRQCIRDLNRKYKQGGFSFRIEKIAGGFQMMTLPAFNPWLSKLIKIRTDNKLSPAALETLAVVAYKQPIIRADVEAIRGVASGEVIRNLMYKGLVKIVGRAEILGRPMLYGTTKKFLDVFGLASLKDLPKVDELKNPEKTD